LVEEKPQNKFHERLDRSKMKDIDKTKDQLMKELADLRQQVSELGQYEHIIETTNNPVGLVDKNYVYQYVNRPYGDAFRTKQKDIINLTVADFFGQDIFINPILTPEGPVTAMITPSTMIADNEN
jgi:hypothetical protein